MSDTDQPVVAKQLLESVKRQRESTERFAEPVATQPACLCGLDTNPVASPRMDIHCPKHDVPGGEPSDMLVSRAGAARAVCLFCADTNRYEAPQRMEGSTRLWRRDKMNSNHGVEQCHAAAILALPAAQPSPAPADEDKHKAEQIVSRLNELLAENYEPSLHDTYDQFLVEQFSAALAKACRAGTPTTNAKERAREIVDEWGGNILPVSTKDYDRSRHGLIDRIASALSSIPSDEVAQRARAVLAAVEIEKLWQPQHTVDDCGACCEYRKAIIAMIQKHCFTATDVEQGTCTWRADGFDRQHTDCDNSIMIGREKFRELKFCAFCGKSLVEATKESEASNVR